MISSVNLYSNIKGEINRFLTSFYDTDLEIYNSLKWEKQYNNPVEIADIVGAFVDNCENYDVHMWISLDNGVYINITEKNANDVIKYLYERYPY